MKRAWLLVPDHRRVKRAWSVRISIEIGCLVSRTKLFDLIREAQRRIHMPKEIRPFEVLQRRNSLRHHECSIFAGDFGDFVGWQRKRGPGCLRHRTPFHLAARVITQWVNSHRFANQTGRFHGCRVDQDALDSQPWPMPETCCGRGRPISFSRIEYRATIRCNSTRSLVTEDASCWHSHLQRVEIGSMD